MSVDIFIKIDGVDGESTDKEHVGWVEIQNISTGITLPFSNSSYSATGGGGNTGRADFDYITFSKFMDKSSVKMQEICGTGETQPKAEIHFCQAGDGKKKHTYMTYIIEKVVIANYSVSASKHDVDRPMESISLAYGIVDMKYTPLKDDGAKDADVTFKYSLIDNDVA